MILTVGILTTNLDPYCMIRVYNNKEMLYLGRIEKMTDDLKELPVDKFEYNGRLCRWEVKVIN